MKAMARLRIALALELLVVALGVAGFHFVEGWSPFDSLYMAIITLSGVGFAEVHPLDGPGRVMTMSLIVAGVFSGAFAIGTVVEVVLGNVLTDAIGLRRMERE